MGVCLFLRNAMFRQDLCNLSSPVIFTSDLHLDLCEWERICHFINFTCLVAKERAILCILGDLFNFWVGDAQALLRPFHSLIQSLRQLSRTEQLLFLQGNRDFLYSNYWRRTWGRVIYDGTILKNSCHSVLVYHGDALCTTDAHFQKVRSWYQYKWGCMASRLLPPFLCLHIGQKLRSVSQKRMAQNKSQASAIDLSTIHHIVANTEADIMICGHFHCQKVLNIPVGKKNKTVYFLPESNGFSINYLLWDKQNLQFCVYS